MTEQRAAEALLATVRHLMTGREIEVCELIASDEVQAYRVLNKMRQTEDCLNSGTLERDRFQLLRNQFSREIADYHNSPASSGATENPPVAKSPAGPTLYSNRDIVGEAAGGEGEP